MEAKLFSAYGGGRVKSLLNTISNMNRSMLIGMSFVVLIAVGTLLLLLPWARTDGQWGNLLDTLFTATSASCVTGLAVLDTGKDFTLFGQLVLIFLIQIGGLGIMTITTLLAVGLKKQINIRQRLLIQESLNMEDNSGIIRLTLQIVKYSLLLELGFGTLLAYLFYDDFGAKGIYWGYWHAVSAFCNAGFDLMGGFTALQTNVAANLCFIVLIVVGGLGFTVIGDLLNKHGWRSYTLHTKLVLIANAVIFLAGTVCIFLLEKGNAATLGTLNSGQQMLGALFQSVSLRTAGFNTIDIASCGNATLFFMMSLMFIGASPTSTGGGIKTTTITVVAASAYALLRNRKDIVFFGRRVDASLVHKSNSVFLLALMWVVVATFLLLVLDDKGQPFQFVLFEVFSAMGTVGMGVGITPEWNAYCKLVLIITMFIGRIGILTFSMSFLNKKVDKLRYPTENILVG